jgi:hypothetical protein
MALVQLSEITAAPVLEGHAYWRSKLVGGRLPARRDVEPLEIPRLLPFVLLSEVPQGDPALLRYRLVGTAVVQMNGRDFTGSGLNDTVADPSWRRYWEGNYRRVIDTRAPLFGADRYGYRARDFVAFEWCILPLASDGATVDMCFEIEAPPAPVSPPPGRPPRASG